MKNKKTPRKKSLKKIAILIGTSNPGKFREIAEVLSGLPFKFIMPRNLKIYGAPKETGKNYEQNARIKAEFFHKKTGLNVLAEDSGIEVDYFKNELGRQTRRWGKGASASDEAWFKHFLNSMRDASFSKRSAKFYCCAALIFNNRLRVFHGSCRGKITRGPEAPILKGLPLSSCFKPIGSKKVYAALKTSEKNRVSHRGKTMRRVRNFLAAALRN